MKTQILAALVAAAIAAGPATAAGPLKTAVFAGGCFWSMEKAFEHAPGVVEAVSGYSGGRSANPTYENHQGHLEAVKVTYDPAKTSYGKLVDHFFRNIDPTDDRGQICDFGPSYRTAVFVGTPEERQTADQAKARVAQVLKTKVATEVRPAARFWVAEGYHQDYAEKNPAHYARYYKGCGRERVLKAVWGDR
jgi:peptide-methionine (S)-S-oxide reductase